MTSIRSVHAAQAAGAPRPRHRRVPGAISHALATASRAGAPQRIAGPAHIGAIAAPRWATLGEENRERHTEGTGRERPPRPLGVAAGVPWQPRQPTRSHVFQSLAVRFLEALDNLPGIQGVAAAALSAVAVLLVRGDTPIPPDVTPEPGSWKFAALGDYGAGTNAQARVAANILIGRPELVITAGDNVYPTGRWIDYARNWDPPQFMGRLARSIAFMPALGNHDMYRDDLRPYFGHFPHLQGRPYYSYVHRNAHFMALDSDQDLRPGSAQYRWLEAELKRSTSTWRVVYLHYPMYGRSPDDFDEIRDAVQPLLARYNVQLLVAGHEHNYTRANPVQGVTHVLTGGGGQQVFPFTEKQQAHVARRKAAFHHVEVSVGRHQLVVRAIDEWGRRIDTVAIAATAAVQAREGAAQLQRTLTGAPTTTRRARLPQSRRRRAPDRA